MITTTKNTVKTKKLLILASTSPIRKALLSRLQIPFRILHPQTDETPKRGEHPKTLVKRLAIQKALSITPPQKESLVIGCDQVATILEVSPPLLFGKPVDPMRAKRQLQKMSGQKVTFLAGLCLYNVATQKTRSCVESYQVQFRTLSDEMIENYLKKELPFHCAAGFKSESLGIALVEKFSGKDPTSLLGLPLIRLCEFLEKEGVEIL